MTPVITLFEHETRAFPWTDRDAAIFDALRRTLGSEVLRPVVRGGQRAIQATAYVGVLRLGQRTVQILPKIHRNAPGMDDRQKAREATRNLLYLLEQTGSVPVREHSIAPLLQRDADWFEILTHLFATNLAREWQRGTVRRYEAVEDVLPVIRGRWLIPEQMRRPERQHLFAVEHDEFTPDNRLNRVFRFVVERLWMLTQDPENRSILGTLRNWMDQVTLLPVVSPAQASPALITRQHRTYEPLLNLARLFLEGAALQLSAGQVAAFAFFFDMNRLFEGFVVSFILRHRVRLLKQPALQVCELRPQARGATLHLAYKHPIGPKVFPLRPDLLFEAASGTLLLLDAKYKQLDPATSRDGVAPDDFYQMFAYAHRYACDRVLLVYPQTADMGEPMRSRLCLEGSSRNIEVATVDLTGDLRQMEPQLLERLAALINEEG